MNSKVQNSNLKTRVPALSSFLGRSLDLPSTLGLLVLSL